jgi:uncharacterized protein with PIN domain
MTEAEELRFACDAMCGGLARWLRAIGYDTSFTPDVDDAELVEHCACEQRVLISADGRLFERRAITSGQVRALRLPRGLRLRQQLEWVVLAMRLDVRPPRCTACNGTLRPVRRDEVQHIVPARSLVWADEFYCCYSCGKAFWNGTHWMRMQRVRERLTELLQADRANSSSAGRAAD